MISLNQKYFDNYINLDYKRNPNHLNFDNEMEKYNEEKTNILHQISQNKASQISGGIALTERGKRSPQKLNLNKESILINEKDHPSNKPLVVCKNIKSKNFEIYLPIYEEDEEANLKENEISQNFSSKSYIINRIYMNLKRHMNRLSNLICNLSNSITTREHSKKMKHSIKEYCKSNLRGSLDHIKIVKEKCKISKKNKKQLKLGFIDPIGKFSLNIQEKDLQIFNLKEKGKKNKKEVNHCINIIRNCTCNFLELFKQYRISETVNFKKKCLWNEMELSKLYKINKMIKFIEEMAKTII